MVRQRSKKLSKQKKFLKRTKYSEDELNNFRRSTEKICHIRSDSKTRSEPIIPEEIILYEIGFNTEDSELYKVKIYPHVLTTDRYFYSPKTNTIYDKELSVHCVL